MASDYNLVCKALVMVAVLLAACGAQPSAPTSRPAATPSPVDSASSASGADWQVEWEKARAGKSEGRLVLHTHANVSFAELAQAFQDQFPEIRVEHSPIRVEEFAPRVISEQRNGQFLWDVTLSPSSTHVRAMGPAGVFQTLPPFFILPDATDDSKWARGAQMYAQNVTNQPISFVYMGSSSGGVAVNREFVPEAEFRNADDLLDPRWRGKIVIDDPSVPRIGSLSLAGFVKEKGEPFVRRLLTEQEPVFSNNQRLSTEWWSTGRYPLLIAESKNISSQFREQGLLRRTERLQPYYLATWAVAAFRNAPHPNATKLFVNWFLSREGQQAYVNAFGEDQGVSRRLDVPPRDLESQPDWSQFDAYVLPNTERDQALVDTVIDLYKSTRR
jgi:iron(III) transport system substrate-binding protein